MRVKAMVLGGTTQERICKALGLSLPTLHKHYRNELDAAKARVGRAPSAPPARSDATLPKARRSGAATVAGRVSRVVAAEAATPTDDAVLADQCYAAWIAADDAGSEAG